MNQLATYLSTGLTGMLSNLFVGLLFFKFYISAGGWAGLIMIIGSAMFVSGLLGSIRTLHEID